MDFADALCRNGTTAKIASVEPLLHGNMRSGFELKIAFGSVRAVIVFQGTFDIDRMGIVSFDEIAVIAIHRSHEIGKRCANAGRKAGAESRSLADKLDGEIGQSSPMAGVFRDEQRLHLRNGFDAISDRRNVRFFVLRKFYHKSNNIIYLLE